MIDLHSVFCQEYISKTESNLHERIEKHFD